MTGHCRRGLAIVLITTAVCLVPAASAQGGLPAWGQEPSPNGGFGPNAFAAVDALSGNDVWAVGK
jgi:hypothetical protein